MKHWQAQLAASNAKVNSQEGVPDPEICRACLRY